jgi:hypothetical protein
MKKNGLVNVKIEQVLIMWTNHKGFVTVRSFAVGFLIFVKVWLVVFCFVLWEVLLQLGAL